MLLSSLTLSGCFDDPLTSTTTETSGSGDGDGDMSGDGDGDPATGDGDGDPTTGDGDGDPTTGDGDGDGDPTTGDGDGDGDGDPEDCSAGPYAVEYTDLTNLDAGANAQGVTFGDVDNDGDLDVISTSRDLHELRVFVGAGDGSFGAPMTTALGSMPFPEIVRGGAIADGVLDVVVRGLGPIAFRMRGDGSGGFTDYESITVPSSHFVLAPVTGDDSLDVVSPGAQSLEVRRSTVGQESYVNHDPIISPAPWGSAVGPLALGDFDNDEDLDVAVAVFGEVYIGAGNSLGNFVFGPQPLTFFGASTDIALGDVNGDDNLDIVVVTAGGGSDAGHLYRGLGDGGFEAEVEISAPSSPRAVALADIDKDGLDDVGIIGDTMAVYLSTGDGFGPAQQANCGLNSRQIAIGDVNGDCVDDVVTVSSSAGEICVMMSTPP